MIWDLFQGYEKAHGRYEVKRTNERGKAEGRAQTILQPATQELWENHLAGTGAGLGIIPLCADNTALWGCIDIDIVTIDHAALENKIIKNNFPLLVARSKSGGAHCFLFMSEPTPAIEVRSALESWAAALGYGGCEVFPKQVSRYNENQDIGNWLNMPYYHAEKTLRYGFKDGVKLTLDEFVLLAEEMRVAPDDLQSVALPTAGLFDDGPPCLQYLHANGGFPEGTRNDGMYNVVVYLRKKFGDDWEAKAQEFNLLMCQPPLSLTELSAIVKSVKRKDYTYRCKLPPIKPHCQRRECMTRACGVGETPESAGAPIIGNVVQYLGDPVLWFLEVEEHRIMMTTDELWNQNLFGKKVAEHTRRALGSMNGARWRKYLDELMQKADPQPVPEEATPYGQFKLLANNYFTGQAQATSKEELMSRFTPFRTGEGQVWFRSRGLLDYLTNHGFKAKSEHHVYQMLKQMGGKSEQVTIKGVNVFVWQVPEPDAAIPDAPLPEFGKDEF